MYEENNKIVIQLKNWNRIKKEFFTFCIDKFGDINYYITPSNGSQLTIELIGVPLSALQDFETELMSKKYNL